MKEMGARCERPPLDTPSRRSEAICADTTGHCTHEQQASSDGGRNSGVKGESSKRCRTAAGGSACSAWLCYQYRWSSDCRKRLNTEAKKAE